MTDYGHDLEFGLLPSPDAARAHEVVELARVAEVSGLDLVTAQDHPYQSRHLVVAYGVGTPQRAEQHLREDSGGETCNRRCAQTKYVAARV